MDIDSEMFSTFNFNVSIESTPFGFDGIVKIYADIALSEDEPGQWEIGISSHRIKDYCLTYWRGGPRVPNKKQLRSFVRKCLTHRRDIEDFFRNLIEDYLIKVREEALQEKAINDWEGMQFDY